MVILWKFAGAARSSQEQPGGIIEETSERYLGRIWQASGNRLDEKGWGSIWEANGSQISYFVTPFATECQSSFKMSISQRVLRYGCVCTQICNDICEPDPRAEPDVIQGPFASSVRTPLAEASLGNIYVHIYIYIYIYLENQYWKVNLVRISAG